MNKRIVTLFCAVLLLQSPFFAEEWILGATPFAIASSDSSVKKELASTAEQLPVLILESLSGVQERVLLPEEVLNRQQEKLQQERSVLIQDLGTAQKKKDGLLFSSSKTKDKEKKELEEKISLLKSHIQEINNSLDKLKVQSENKEYDSLVIPKAHVRLWGDSVESLYKALIPEKQDTIHGLLTGSVTPVGNYVSAEVRLTLYPGDMTVVSLQEVSSLSDVQYLAQSLSKKLILYITNQQTTKVYLTISPTDALPFIYVDGQKIDYNSLEVVSLPDSTTEQSLETRLLSLPADIHTVTIGATGYESKTFEQDFSENPGYAIAVTLEKTEYTDVVLDAGGKQGSVYINGLPAGALSETLQLPQGRILGEVTVPNASQSDFFIADIGGNDLSTLNLRLREENDDISQLIDKRRRTMYNSYSALLISVIPLLITNGLYVNTYNAWALGHEDESNVNTWNIISKTSMGITIGLGVNWAVQLARYLFTVNKILPQSAQK
ncbi:MAG: hypothetical protein PUI38_09365 [Candidatus Treponema excrementipullorum]|nr:hypothetical protein [Candidatus Treponema excrementipullorum]MDY4708767.1 hypothetical protein [Candidatus Treponema excrementipullorum]